MPIIITCLLIAIICILNWDFVTLNVSIIGTLATALAFFATAWTAYEARSSAKAAFRAVELTRESLSESKKTAFKQWYSLLLEKNSERQKDVNEYLNGNVTLCEKLNADCALDRVYNTITKDSVLSSYVRGIYHILSYVDREYYGDNLDLQGRMVFAEQLADIIPDRLKIVIAIYGLNYESLDHVENAKLRELLHKFDFFKNNLFFDVAINELHYIDRFISERFINTYRNHLFSAISHQIEHDIYTSMPLEVLNRRSSPNLLFSILYAYKNPAKTHIEYVFGKYFDHTISEVLCEIDRAMNRHKLNLREMKRIKGYCVSIKPHRKCSDSRRLKTAGDIINLTRKYILKIQSGHQAMILMSNVRFCHPTTFNDNKDGRNFERMVQTYALTLNLLKLRVDKDRQAKIKSLVTLANAEIMKDYNYLKSLSQ